MWELFTSTSYIYDENSWRICSPCWSSVAAPGITCGSAQPLIFIGLPGIIIPPASIYIFLACVCGKLMASATLNNGATGSPTSCIQANQTPPACVFNVRSIYYLRIAWFCTRKILLLNRGSLTSSVSSSAWHNAEKSLSLPQQIVIGLS